MAKAAFTRDSLIAAAKKARDHSYSPYSSCKVGAAVLTTTGEIFAGCNVENSSYGATICAERVAIQTAIAQIGAFKISEIVVMTDATPPWPPCGMCRQVISEFAVFKGKKTQIHLVNLKGKTRSFAFSDLMPEAFTPESMK